MSDEEFRLAQSVACEVRDELLGAMTFFPPMRSAHEGYAIILEELDELWEEVRNNKKPMAKANQRKEAIQVAAMAMRFVIDISDQDKHRNERDHSIEHSDRYGL